jgi:hypothetical protein
MRKVLLKHDARFRVNLKDAEAADPVFAQTTPRLGREQQPHAAQPEPEQVVRQPRQRDNTPPEPPPPPAGGLPFGDLGASEQACGRGMEDDGGRDDRRQRSRARPTTGSRGGTEIEHNQALIPARIDWRWDVAWGLKKVAVTLEDPTTGETLRLEQGPDGNVARARRSRTRQRRSRPTPSISRPRSQPRSQPTKPAAKPSKASRAAPKKGEKRERERQDDVQA